MKKIYILFLVITSYTCTAQILLNGRLIHELPAKSSVDTGDLIIVANPTTGKPYKARKNQVVAGANGVTDGDKGDIIVTGSGAIFTIAGSSVQNGKLALMGNRTYKANLAGTTASPQDATSDQVIADLGINLKMAYADTASLSNRINAKQNTLVSGTNIKSVNGNSLIGSGDVTITSSVAWGNITGSNIMLQTDLRDSFEHRIAAGTTGQYWRGDKTWQTLNKAAVGLSAVDNTPDVDKPISNATNAALAGKQAQLVSGTNIKTINFIDLLGSGNINISGGGGGGETLDQTLALGNATDTGMIFDPNSYATNYEFIRVNPIDTFSSQVPFRMTRWNVPQNSGAVAGNEGLMFGFNLASGGGAIESGKPAIGYSIESNYLPDYSTRYVEWHDLYVPSVTANGLTAGNQVRLSSYTINAATNNIDLYRTVGREYLFIPGTSTQYWIVQPGSFRITESGGDYVGHSISAHRYTISGSGDTTMSFQGFDYINFGGAALSNLELPQFLPLYYDTLISGVLGTFKVMDLSNRSKYMQFDAQYSNSALQLIGNGLNKLWTTDITEFKMLFASSNNMLLDMEGIRFTGSGQKWLWADDLTMKLGVNTSYRFSEAWVRDGHFNQMAIQSKAGNPTTSDVADGMWMVWKNTTTGDTYLYMNDGGTMKRIASPFVTF